MATTPTVLVMQSLLTATAAATSRDGVFNSGMGDFVGGIIDTNRPVDPSEEVTQIFDPREASDPLPRRVAEGLVNGMSGVTPEDAARLREWMRDRGLRASSWINASQYLVDMNRETRAFETSEKRYLGSGRELVLHEGRDRQTRYYWIGANDPSVQVFLTQGGDTRQVHHGRPVRLRPGDVVTFDGKSFEMVVDRGVVKLFRTRMPAVLSPDEPTVVTRVPGRR